MSKEQEELEYQPSKSSRVASPIAALEDRWEEWLTVCEVVNPRTQQNQLEIRSFFESTTTKEKVWDEPPSGAVNIVWASDEAKEMAAAQILDLQIVKGEDTIKTKDDQTDEKKKKKFSLKNIFKRRDIEIRTPDGKMAYKPGSNTALFVGTKDTVDEHNMQLQIAMSESLKLQDQGPNPSMNFNEEDDIDLATALSLSELDIHDQSSPNSLISQEQEDRKPAAK
jgi:hypothetical protein